MFQTIRKDLSSMVGVVRATRSSLSELKNYRGDWFAFVVIAIILIFAVTFACIRTINASAAMVTKKSYTCKVYKTTPDGSVYVKIRKGRCPKRPYGINVAPSCSTPHKAGIYKVSIRKGRCVVKKVKAIAAPKVPDVQTSPAPQAPPATQAPPVFEDPAPTPSASPSEPLSNACAQLVQYRPGFNTSCEVRPDGTVVIMVTYVGCSSPTPSPNMARLGGAGPDPSEGQQGQDPTVPVNIDPCLGGGVG